MKTIRTVIKWGLFLWLLAAAPWRPALAQDAHKPCVSVQDLNSDKTDWKSAWDMSPTCGEAQTREYYDAQIAASAMAINGLLHLSDKTEAWDPRKAAEYLKVIRDLAARFEADYAPSRDAQGHPLGGDMKADALDRLDAEFARHQWPAPKTLAGGFDWLSKQLQKQYQPDRKLMLDQARDSARGLLSNISEYENSAVATAREADEAKAAAIRHEVKTEYAREHDTYAGHVALRMERFIKGFSSSMAFLAAVILILWFASRSWMTLGRAILLFLSGALAAIIVAIPDIFLLPESWSKGILPGILGMLLWGYVWALVWHFPQRLGRQLGWFQGKRGGQASNGPDTHGSAAWATTDSLIQRGRILPTGRVLADSFGFALGRATNAPADHDGRVRYMGHVLTCAPTGAGKGVSAVIPTLLEYPGSALVIDIKGENYAVTAARRRAMGHDVFLVDPYGVVAGFGREDLDATAHGFNWLSMLDPANPDVVGDAAALADMLVVPSKDAKHGSHFDDTARNFLAGLIAWVAGSEDPAARTMAEVRRLLALPYASTVPDVPTLQEVLAEMQALPDFAHGVPYRAANSLLAAAQEERGSILSTALRHTAFLDDPRIATALSGTDFDLRDLKRKPMTVYLVLPPNRLEANTRFLRGFIGQALAAITSVPDKPPYHVLFLLDEFAQLGPMRAVEQAVTLVRGYGARFWLFVQDLSQLKGTYGDRWQTFMANGAKQFFGTGDYDTAKLISDSLGQRTVAFQTASQNTNEGYSSNWSHAGGGGGSNSGTSKGVTQQLTGRALLTPDEIMARPSHEEIVLIPGERPALLAKLNYLRDPDYAGLAAANPYH